MSGPKILVGCDPELFLRDKETHEYVSAWGVIPGDKKAPHPVKDGAIQVDGNAVEFNIIPAGTREEWISHIKSVQQQLAAALPPNLELVCEPAVTFSAKEWARLPDEAKVLGCDPDFNAYTGKQNPMPNASTSTRGAGGHIHIGFTEGKDPKDVDHFEDCRELAKQLDYYIGVPSLAWDRDLKRREFYGKAGSFRVKPYGMEYRTPSNMWLSDPELIRYVYDAAQAATQDLFDGIAMRELIHDDNYAKDYIDTGSQYFADAVGLIQSNSARLKTANARNIVQYMRQMERAKLEQKRMAQNMKAGMVPPDFNQRMIDPNFRFEPKPLNLADVARQWEAQGLVRPARDLAGVRADRVIVDDAGPMDWNNVGWAKAKEE